MADERARREFLKTISAAVGATLTTGGVADAESSAQSTGAAASAPAPSQAPRVYQFLTPPEAAFVEAAVDRFIPADDLSPSGTDCGVAEFIDRQLAGAWGSGDRLYMQGPWGKGAPTQGYQLPMTPAEFFRAGIASVTSYCVRMFRKEFDRLTAAQQTDVLQGLERGQIALDEVPGRQFFDLLLDTAMQGFFADPIYGGNRDKVAWKMIGFPGVIAIYAEHIKTYRNRKYDGEPTSIADLS